MDSKEGGGSALTRHYISIRIDMWSDESDQLAKSARPWVSDVTTPMLGLIVSASSSRLVNRRESKTGIITNKSARVQHFLCSV